MIFAGLSSVADRIRSNADYYRAELKGRAAKVLDKLGWGTRVQKSKPEKLRRIIFISGKANTGICRIAVPEIGIKREFGALATARRRFDGGRGRN